MSTENTLWMGDIEPTMTEQIILEAFYYYDIKPISVKLIKDKKTNTYRNYCFINFDNIIEANKALSKLNGKKFPNSSNIFKLNWSNYNSEFNKNVYVGNLPQNVDDIELYNFFKQKYNSVHHASVILDNGISKQYGFVHFLNEADYENCLKEMDGVIFHGNNIRVRERNRKNFNDENNNSKNKLDDVKNNKNNLQKNNKYFLINKKKYTSYNNNNNNNNKNNNNNNCNSNNNNNCNNINYNTNYNLHKKGLDINSLDLNEVSSFYPKNKFRLSENSGSSLTENEDSTVYSQDKELNLSSSCTSVPQKRKFSYNFDLLESNDECLLNKKIQESINKTLEHYKYSCSFTKNNYRCK